MRVFQGNLVGTGLRFAIVVSRFNDLISNKLFDGAVDALTRHDVRHQDIEVYWAPGAWELPLLAKEIALTGRHDGVIALGAVIKGETPHFEYVCAEMSKGLAAVSLETRVPISLGVLTTANLEQALQRSGSKAGNKGADAAMAALEMANILSKARNVADRGQDERD